MTEETSTAESDWVANAATSIINIVDKAKTTGTENVVRAIRAAVFGLVALVFGIAAIIFSIAIMVRLADAYLPIGAGVSDATWAAHLFIGTLLSIIGFGLWASRTTENLRRVWIAVGLDLIIIVATLFYALIGLFD